MIEPKLTDGQVKQLLEKTDYYMKHGITSSSLLVSTAIARLGALGKSVEAAGGLCECGHTSDSHIWQVATAYYPTHNKCIVDGCARMSFTQEPRP